MQTIFWLIAQLRKEIVRTTHSLDKWKTKFLLYRKKKNGKHGIGKKSYDSFCLSITVSHCAGQTKKNRCYMVPFPCVMFDSYTSPCPLRCTVYSRKKTKKKHCVRPSLHCVHKISEKGETYSNTGDHIHCYNVFFFFVIPLMHTSMLNSAFFLASSTVPMHLFWLLGTIILSDEYKGKVI